jgi:hypothetical protein
VAGICELVMKVTYRWGILDQQLNHYLPWKDSVKGGLFSESAIPEHASDIFLDMCYYNVKGNTLSHIIKINRASATIEWRYTSALPDVFMTWADTALHCVSGCHRNTGWSRFMPQVTFLRNSKQIG